MLRERDAEVLRDTLDPLLPEFEVTAVPWHNEGPRAEHIVTVWDADGVPLLDIFEFGREYVLRRLGRGPEVGRTNDPARVAELVREFQQARKA